MSSSYHASSSIFQSTLPARGATVATRLSRRIRPYFNPRSPHGERPLHNSHQIRNLLFQSTLPARGATYWYDKLQKINLFQSTLPARGATTATTVMQPANYISIHAPRTGSDVTPRLVAVVLNGISIHAPRTGSDTRNRRKEGQGNISIHAPRTGSDDVRAGLFREGFDFNPRSPHGERRCPRGSFPGGF